jgi:hypothetical protein
MLVFVDQDRHIRVVRAQAEDGANSRTPIGRIQKNRLEIDDELRALLSPSEVDEVEGVIEVYRHGASAKAAYHALNYPAITREVMDHFEGEATMPERRLIMGALMDAVRRMRKFERENHSA